MILASIPIYILNLQSRTDRKEHMIKLMSQVGFTNYSFVIPELADDVLITRLKESNVIAEDNSDVNKYKASHTVTYLKLLKEIPDERFIIVEDDITPTGAASQVLNSLANTIESTPPDFDMIYLEYCHESCSFDTTPSDKLNDPLCAGAILWNKASALKLVADLKDESNNIDFWFQKRIKEGTLKAYGSYPPIFRQDNTFGSDLPINGLPLFLRRAIFSDKDRDCKQTGVVSVITKIGVGYLAYRVIKSMFKKAE